MSSRSSTRRESVNQALNQKAEKQVKLTEREGDRTPKTQSAQSNSISPQTKKNTDSGTASASDFKSFQEEIRIFFQKYDDKLDKRLSVFDQKFSSIFEELKKEINSIKVEALSTKTELKEMKTKVDEMEKSVEFNAQYFEERDDSIRTLMSKYENEIKELKAKLLHQELHDRRYNLLFYGFEEKAKENLETVMKQFFQDKLELLDTDVEQMIFSNIHRIPTEAKGPKPVIIKFARMSDRDMVFKKSLHPVLRTERKRILSDLPVTMKRERGRLAKVAYNIRKDEQLQTRIVEKGLTLSLKVRKEKGKPWSTREAREEKEEPMRRQEDVDDQEVD